jgi:hypothetical protein
MADNPGARLNRLRDAPRDLLLPGSDYIGDDIFQKRHMTFPTLQHRQIGALHGFGIATGRTSDTVMSDCQRSLGAYEKWLPRKSMIAAIIIALPTDPDHGDEAVYTGTDAVG